MLGIGKIEKGICYLSAIFCIIIFIIFVIIGIKENENALDDEDYDGIEDELKSREFRKKLKKDFNNALNVDAYDDYKNKKPRR